MLPLSHQGRTFYVWVCNMPSCAYVVSYSGIQVTYYKGTAAATHREKDGKTYQEFSF
jgi:hypothetical protein